MITLVQHFTFKDHINDFIVEETLPYKPTGSGQLYYVYIQKTTLSTGELLQKIIRYTGLKRQALGICGLKDKRGLTRQRISIYKKDINQSVGLKKFVDFLNSFVKVLEVTEDDRFLTMGSNRGNRFMIKLRPITSNDLATWQSRVTIALQHLLDHGVPNYFGEQRFGHTKTNRQTGQDLLTGKIRKISDDIDSIEERKFKIQAFVSFVFNKIVEKRLKDKTFDTVLSGDILIKDPYQPKAQGLITAPVYGADLKRPKESTASFLCEQAIFDEFGLNTKTLSYCEKIKLWGLRRSIAMPLYQCKHRIDKEGNIILTLELGSGSYASTFLEELDKAIEHLKPKKYSNKPKSRMQESDIEQYDPTTHKSASTKLKQQAIAYKASKTNKNPKKYDPTTIKKTPVSSYKSTKKADTGSRSRETIRRREFDDSGTGPSYRSYSAPAKKTIIHPTSHDLSSSDGKRTYAKPSASTYQKKSTPGFYNKGTKNLRKKAQKEGTTTIQKSITYQSESGVTIVR